MELMKLIHQTAGTVFNRPPTPHKLILYQDVPSRVFISKEGDETLEIKKEAMKVGGNVLFSTLKIRGNLKSLPALG